MQKAPQLPRELLSRIAKSNNDRAYASRQTGSIGRKQRRKAERVTKRSKKREDLRHRGNYEGKEARAEDGSDASLRDTPVVATHKPRKRVEQLSRRISQDRPLLSTEPRHKIARDGATHHSRKKATATLSNEDKDILALERKLGVKANKAPRVDEEDGLEELLTGLGASSESEGSTPSDAPEELNSLKRKREKVNRDVGSKRANRGGESSESDESKIGAFSRFNLEEAENSSDSSNDISKKSEYEVLRNRKSNKTSRSRENPYIAPSTSMTDDVPAEVKYKSSSFRADPEPDTRVKRQLQGLLNRLTEANLMTVFHEVEEKYRDNSRQSITSMLTELILNSVADEVALNETFLVMQAAFTTSLYRAIGTDFGAYMVDCVVRRIDEKYKKAEVSGKGKECLNLITFLANLFIFNVIGNSLIFDYVRIFLRTVTELNTELLLRIVKTCGTQLRQDDPLALKDIVIMLQEKIGQMNGDDVSVRTKVMVETITALKDNRMRTNVAGSNIISEQVKRMRKLLGSLSSGTIRAREPLRVGLDDVRNASQKGKWWLVGASWRQDQNENRESEEIITPRTTTPITNAANSAASHDPDQLNSRDNDEMDLDLIKLAKEQLMITDVRRSIFVAIMSASDYRDAYIRLMKLKLKRVQEAEVPKVLLHCVAAETSYNPYYSFVARRLCGEYRLRMAFQHCLWNFLGRLRERRTGETYDNEDDEDDDDDDSDSPSHNRGQKARIRRMQSTKIVTFAHLYGSLIAQGSLSLSALKVIEFDRLKPQTKLFLEILLITIILDSQKKAFASSSSSSSSSSTTSFSHHRSKGQHDEQKKKMHQENLSRVFSDAREFPELAQGLQYFVRRAMMASDIVEEHAQSEVIGWACERIEDVLTSVGTGV